MKKPNVIFVFADQMRAQATGFYGNSQVSTPNLDRLAGQSLCFTNAISNCPVCSPYRGSLITGQYPLTHGVFVNDVHLEHRCPSIADCFTGAGYDTAYIGKWHLNGRGRTSYIPPQDRQGFDYWKVLECTHQYNESPYYDNNCEEQKMWEGYDAQAQTADAIRYISEQNTGNPFFLMLSWGPPHSPYQSAPQKFRDMYNPEDIVLRPNVPEDAREKAAEDLAGYYAHISALDEYMGRLLNALKEQGLAEDTLVVFTSDHGDMHGSHGYRRKQKPFEESILVPFLLNAPGIQPAETDILFNAPDIMPTLLGLCGIPVPDSVEGIDHSGFIRGGEDVSDDAALIANYHPFGEWARKHGGIEYRGVRTKTHTYVRSLEGPWLLYDNINDPFQLKILIEDPGSAELVRELEKKLSERLKAASDEFRKGEEYTEAWNYPLDESGTVPF